MSSILTMQERQGFLASIGFEQYPEWLNPLSEIHRIFRPEAKSDEMVRDIKKIVKGLRRAE